MSTAAPSGGFFSKLWPVLAGAGSATIMVLAFFVPSIQDQWDRYHSREILERYVSLGDELSAEERYDAAEKAYEKAFELSLQTRLDIEMKRLAARVNRLSMAEEWGAKPPEDIEDIDFQLLLHLQNGSQHREQRLLTLNSYALYLAGTGKPAEAEAPLREALQLDPKNPLITLNLGNLCDELGRKPEAEKWYRETIQHDAGNVRAHYNLGLLLIELGRENEARESLIKAQKLAPEDKAISAQLQSLPPSARSPR